MSGIQSSVNQSGPDKSALDTTQIDAELASWGVRVCAKLIDAAVIWGPFTVLWFVGMYFMAEGPSSLGWLFYIVSCVEAVVGWGWIIYETGKTGQSIGKRVMRTRLVGQGGVPIGFGHAFLHEAAQLIVDILPICIGYLWPLVDKKRQTFSDKISRTRTFRIPSNAA